MIDPGSPTIMSRSSVMSSPDTSNPDHKEAKSDTSIFCLASRGWSEKMTAVMQMSEMAWPTHH
jgi:hypothetical protein